MIPRRLVAAHSALTAAWLASALVASAQLPQPKLHTVFPPGAKLGGAVDVAVTGVELDEAQLRFNHPGITAKALAAANQFNITVAANVPPGAYEARVLGRFGLSNPRTFVVGTLTEAAEKSGNGSPETALEIAMESTVNGRTDSQASDYYKFAVKKGQRVLVSCAARELDSRAAAALLLLAPDGRELERARQGGLLDHTATADGTLLVKVHDFVYRGGDQYFYRLTVTTGPHVDFVFPPAAEQGKATKVTVFGRNLPGGSPAKFTVEGKALDQLTVDLTAPGDPAARQRLATTLSLGGASAGLDGFEYRVKGASGALSNPALLTFATGPVTTEVEPNNSPDKAQSISLPGSIAGQFATPNDRDWFAFDAKKGDAFWLEVTSHRLGLPTAPHVVIQKATKNEKGEVTFTDVQELTESVANTGGPEFNTAHRDPLGRFEAKEDASYRLGIRDLFGRTVASPRHVYLLTLRKESPDFRLVAVPDSAPTKKAPADVYTSASSLWRGEALPIKLLVFRRDGFKEDIHVSVAGLPAGVTASAVRIPATSNSISLFLAAKDDAPAALAEIKITGTAKTGDTQLVREARLTTVNWDLATDNNTTEAPHTRLARSFPIAVTDRESAPLTFAMEAKQPLETCVFNKLLIPVNFTRRADFKTDVKLKVTGHKELEKIPELAGGEKTKSIQLVLNLAEQKLAPGEHTFWLQTRAKGKMRPYMDAAKSAEDAAKAAEKIAADATKAAKEAKDAAAKVTAPAEAKTAAEKTAKEAEAKAKEAEAKKAAAAAAMKQMTDKSKPRDVDAAFYSLPITLKVTAAPITLSEPAAQSLSQGGKVEVPVKLARLYDFKDPVDVNLVVPASAKGISAAKLTIPRDGTAATLALETKPDATPGEHKLTVQAELKLNGQTIKVDQPLVLKVAAVEKPKAK
ncbi:MAG: hypothetical protein B9S33_18015 [Pedosphaera sp. Tous-C6FEB]|nr:MAG: hypothetical protein B9S33_18015 [Pedosphaera sp. Tous-C6FEB]